MTKYGFDEGSCFTTELVVFERYNVGIFTPLPEGQICYHLKPTVSLSASSELCLRINLIDLCMVITSRAIAEPRCDTRHLILPLILTDRSALYCMMKYFLEGDMICSHYYYALIHSYMYLMRVKKGVTLKCH